MRLIYVDDEKNALVNFYYDTREREGIQSIEYFLNPVAALDYAKGHTIDGAFLDMTMPEMDGITLAKELKTLNPDIEIVYITGSERFAYEAYQVGGRAYLTKPYSDEELDEVFALLHKLIKHEDLPTPQTEIAAETKGKSPGVFMKTFGNFDMIIDDQPVKFQNSKAKELLALLVDQRGGSVTSNQIFLKLWEDKEYGRTTSTYVRRTVRALQDQLAELGLSHIMTSHRNAQNINLGTFYCDYYDVMQDSETFLYEYNGYYMQQYSWAEETVPLIDNKVKSLRKKGK